MEEGAREPAERGSANEIPSDIIPSAPPAERNSTQGGLNRVIRKLNDDCLKTVLDLEECRKVAQEARAKKDEQLQNLVRSAPVEAARQFVDNCRQATTCKARWEDMSGVDTFRICHRCKLHVYDFSEMDQSEAKELVFKREMKDSPFFYRRNDGKFLTTDCPIGVKQKQTSVIIAAMWAALFTAIVAFVLMSPKPAAPVRTMSSLTENTKSGTNAEYRDIEILTSRGVTIKRVYRRLGPNNTYEWKLK